MLALAFWILLVAAVGGISMAALDAALRPLRMGHGILAGVGLLILLGAALAQGSQLIWSAFGLIAVGFSAGAVLFGLVWRDSAPPRPVIYAHGIINTLGLITLGVAVFS